MNIINGITSYINENETKITILKNKINIVNYKDIGHFDTDKIIIKDSNKDILIYGNDLVVSKLMKEEILITGNFSKIEFR